MQVNSNRSIGFSTYGYNQVILFSSENDFKEIVAANPNMTAIIGADDYTRQNFPGVYVAGVKASWHEGQECEQSNAEAELMELLTPEELQSIGESIADIVRQHHLQRSPDVCRKLFSYLSDVIDSWNSV